ncbi:MAG TPA: helix-turn-helix domain-containing protein [Aggregatilineales bacterium]|nr:helix-turn-helix domain-containing protein [Aggregatilineales bacterium]
MSDALALGNDLRDSRQNRGLTLEQVEKQIKVRARYLDALERGDYAALPSPVQARGFLRNYARVLGLDPDLIVARFDAVRDGGSKRKRRTATMTAVPATDPAPTSTAAGRRNVNRRVDPTHSTAPTAPAASPTERRQGSWLGTALIGAVALVFLVGLVAMGGPFLQTLIAQNGGAGQAILSPLPNTPTPSWTPTFTPTPNAPTRLPVPAGAYTNTPSPSGGAVTLQIQIEERTWLRVIVDGNVAFMNAPAPGTLLRFQGNIIQIRAADGAGIHAVFNGTDLGILGQRETIMDRTFTIGGMAEATATPGSGSPPTSAAALKVGENLPVTAAKSVSTSPPATFSFTPGTPASPTRLPTFPPTRTASLSATPSMTASSTCTPSITATPSRTFTPSATYTPSRTPTPSDTLFVLPHDTSTPDGGGFRPH